jgi:TPP-dependent pyruvate/acetoin dehydrogenase alpha subunit
MNLAALWSLPVVFVCENNLYASTTRISDVMLNDSVAERAAAYRMPGATIDGNDVLAVYEAVSEAVARARAGDGPTLVECLTYRRGGHKREDPGTYRRKEEVDAWLTYDPVHVFRERLLRHGVAQAEIESIEAHVLGEIDDAAEFALSSDYPPIGSALEHVYA